MKNKPRLAAKREILIEQEKTEVRGAPLPFLSSPNAYIRINRDFFASRGILFNSHHLMPNELHSIIRLAQKRSYYADKIDDSFQKINFLFKKLPPDASDELIDACRQISNTVYHNYYKQIIPKKRVSRLYAQVFKAAGYDNETHESLAINTLFHGVFPLLVLSHYLIRTNPSINMDRIESAATFNKLFQIDVLTLFSNQMQKKIFRPMVVSPRSQFFRRKGLHALAHVNEASCALHGLQQIQANALNALIELWKSISWYLAEECIIMSTQLLPTGFVTWGELADTLSNLSEQQQTLLAPVMHIKKLLAAAYTSMYIPKPHLSAQLDPNEMRKSFNP